MIAYLRREYTFWRARRRLEKLIAKAKASYDCESYRRHRAAALRGLG